MLVFITCIMSASVMIKLYFSCGKMNLRNSKRSDVSPSYWIKLISIQVLRVLDNQSWVVVKYFKKDDSCRFEEFWEGNVNHKILIPSSYIFSSYSQIICLSRKRQIVVHIVIKMLFCSIEVGSMLSLIDPFLISVFLCEIVEGVHIANMNFDKGVKYVLIQDKRACPFYFDTDSFRKCVNMAKAIIKRKERFFSS